MKFRKFLSALLFSLGCILSFTGMLTIVLPQIENYQLHLVLSSFQMNSENVLVQSINKVVTFALQQNWRLLYLGLLVSGTGAALLVHFTPAKPKPTDQPPAKPISIEPKEEKTNPFARAASYQAQMPAATQASFPSSLIPFDKTVDHDTSPYYSPRFAAETQAVESEAGAISQSGSRILIRNISEPTEAVSEQPHMPVCAEISPVSHNAASSSRIRSTMGMHSSRKTNLAKWNS